MPSRRLQPPAQISPVHPQRLAPFPPRTPGISSSPSTAFLHTQHTLPTRPSDLIQPSPAAPQARITIRPPPTQSSFPTPIRIVSQASTPQPRTKLRSPPTIHK